jgi:hypothetical protein
VPRAGDLRDQAGGLPGSAMLERLLIACSRRAPADRRRPRPPKTVTIETTATVLGDTFTRVDPRQLRPRLRASR